MASGECGNGHRWKFKKDKSGTVTRKCTVCKLKIKEIAVTKGSSLDGDFKYIRPKGKHYNKK